MRTITFLLATCIIVGSTAQLSAQNILSNGGFENAGTGWNLQAQTDFLADVTYPTTSAPEGTTYAMVHVSQVTVTDPQLDNWKVQLQAPQWEAVKNGVYRMAFKARSTAKQMKVGINRAGGAYVSGNDIPLDTAWQTYSYMFISDTAGTGMLRLNFYIGADTGVYEFDSVALEKTSETTPTTNLILNGGFELEGAGWGTYIQRDAGADAQIEYPSSGAAEGTRYASVRIKITGEASQVQLQAPLFTAEAGAIYTITYKARGSSSIYIVSQGDQATNFQIKETWPQELAAEWATYSAQFTSDVEGYGALRLNFHAGSMAGTYDFDSVFIAKTAMTGARTAAKKAAHSPHLTLRKVSGGVMIALPGSAADGSYSLSAYTTSGRLLGNRSGVYSGCGEIMLPLTSSSGMAILVYADRRGTVFQKVGQVR